MAGGHTTESEAKSRQLPHSSFDDQLSGNLPTGYIKPWRRIDDVNRSSVLRRSQPACFHEMGSIEKYEHVAPFLHAFLIRSSRHANIFSSKSSMLFLRDMTFVYWTDAAVNENDLV